MENVFSTHTLNDLLVILNSVEKKFAPLQIYTSGKIQLPLTSRRVAIVGSRKASLEGITEAKRIAKFMVQHNIRTCIQ